MFKREMIRFFRLALMVALFQLSTCAKPAPELSGIIIYGHEVRTIQLCGDSQVFWLHVTQEEQQKLLAQSRSLTSSPYQELYLEFTGSLMDEAPGEFAKEYAGAVKVESIKTLSVVIPDSCGRLKPVP